MVVIRPASETEAGLIASLSRQTFTETFAEFNSEADMTLFLATQFTVEMLVAETRLPGFNFFITWLEDQPIGYIKLCSHLNGLENVQLGQPVLEISRIYVISNFIGLGIGQLMMDFVLHYANENEYAVVCLGVWENNLRAIRFYQKNGFEKVGEIPFLLGTDRQTDWMMARRSRNCLKVNI